MEHLGEIKGNLKFLHFLKILPVFSWVRSGPVRSTEHIMTSKGLLNNLPCHVRKCDKAILVMLLIPSSKVEKSAMHACIVQGLAVLISLFSDFVYVP